MTFGDRKKPLKRTGFKSRGKPLAPGKPLKRSGGLARTGGLARSASTVKRPKDTGPTGKVKDLVDGRAGATTTHPGVCEFVGCGRKRADRHHRLNRKMGGRDGDMAVKVNGAEWLVDLCDGHHALVTRPDRADAALVAEVRAIFGDYGRSATVRVLVELLGYVLREQVEGRPVDAAKTEILTRHRVGPILLNADGSITETEWPPGHPLHSSGAQ